MSDTDSTYDHIVVGAGSAGAALAARLTEDARRSVLLLEAGGSDRNFWIRTPIGYGRVYYDARFNWKYMTEPVPGLGGRTSYWPRGKVLGGSSSINAMVYVRGHPDDYDDWSKTAPGWGWGDVAPVFQRMERYRNGGNAVRGTDGPLGVLDIDDQVHELCHAYLAAAERAGLARNPDYNGTSMEGAFTYQLTIRDGRRASTARSYLEPAQRRENLGIVTQAHATALTFEGRRVTGLRYRRGTSEHRVSARRSVVLCAGAVNTPQLLMLSGLGPEEHLRAHGIEVRRDMAHVGQNLQDHLGADVLYRANRPSLNQQLNPWWGKLREGLRYLAFRRGPLALSINQAGGFARSDPALDRPDLQLYFSPLSYTRAPPGTRPLMNPDPFPGFLFGFNPCKPESRGEIGLASADPFAAPRIQPNYLATEGDRALMRAGIRMVRRIAREAPLAEAIDSELAPGPEIAGDEELDAFLRDVSWTVFHPCGTCRMGSDPAHSVVDPRLRVHGIEGLRIADASIFPTIPTGNTNAPAIMIGERAADLIREDETE